VPALEMRHTCAVGKDRAGSAPAAASAYFTDSSYVRTILQLVNKQMGLTPRGLPIPYNRNRNLARPRCPACSIYPTHSATTQGGENCCATNPSKIHRPRRFAGGHEVSRIGRDEDWNSQTHPNGKDYDLFEVGRSHFGNPGVVVSSEAGFLLKGMNLALHLRHLAV
jgi:hypothetical protein